MVVDTDFILLAELATVFDANLARLKGKVQFSPDPDGMGYFDSTEHLVGLGFAACQTYLTATMASHNIKKGRGLALRPIHPPSTLPVVTIVHAAANYWKHHDEWAVEGPKRGKETIRVISALGVELTGYTLSKVLHELTHPEPTCFSSVLRMLVLWHDALPKL